MARERQTASWGELTASVVRALLELVAAELDGLRGELADSGRRAGRLAALAGAAFGVAFWGLGALTAGAIAALALWLPTWGAALSVAGLLFLIGGALALAVRSGWRKLESPAVPVRRRLDDHVAWWHSEILDSVPGAGPDEENAERRPGGLDR